MEHARSALVLSWKPSVTLEDSKNKQGHCEKIPLTGTLLVLSGACALDFNSFLPSDRRAKLEISVTLTQDQISARKATKEFYRLSSFHSRMTLI